MRDEEAASSWVAVAAAAAAGSMHGDCGLMLGMKWTVVGWLEWSGCGMVVMGADGGCGRCIGGR